MPTLPLTPVVNIDISISAVAAPRTGFNLGLILGSSSVISTSDRVKVYASIGEMVTAGFATNSVEYLAAVQYFAALSKPTQIAIGRQGSGESTLQAITACRGKNVDWYCAYAPSGSNNDHIAVAPYIEAVTPVSTYMLQNSDSAVLNNTTSNLFAQLNAAGYSRTLGLYSTSNYAVANVMGYAMGATTDLNNSAYTLDNKTLPTATPESLTTNQVINIQVNKGNDYVNRGRTYNVFEKGTMFNGSFFDEIIFLDKLSNELQLSVMDLLYNSPKVPQTEDGMAQIKHVCAIACNKMVRIGFLAPGQWNGPAILSKLNTGDFLSAGFLILSDPINSQSQADRDARKAPPIYIAAKEAGAVQSVLIKLNVNR